MMIQPKSPTEVLVSRHPHANGVTWIFHDPATSYVRHVNVPNVHPVAQQQPYQGSAQVNHGNEMVLYQPLSNRVTQHVTVRPGATGLLTDIECSRVRDSSWMYLTSLVTIRIGIGLAAVQRKLPDYVVVGFQHNQHLRQYKQPHRT